MICYKLVNIDDEGILHPLYINKKEKWQVGDHLTAFSGQQTKNGKVKSSLGELAYRPGLHCSVLPFCHHIGKKRAKNDIKPSFRDKNQVWIECETIGNDCTKIAQKNSNSPRDQCFKHTEWDGFYFYKTNSNASELNKWIISKELKILRLLTDKEVNDINAQYGVADLPRL
jgi:hypothetical protein